MNKINKLFENDELLTHKIGLLVGTLSGIFLGLVVSKRADDFESLPPHEIIQENPDGPQEN